MRDYWCSAMVRRSEGVNASNWYLWTARIQAPDLSTARRCALRLIAHGGLECGNLDMLWDTTPAIVSSAEDYDVATMA